MSEGFVLVHMHIESEKDNLVESRQKSGRQKWLSCTVVGISSEIQKISLDCCYASTLRKRLTLLIGGSCLGIFEHLVLEKIFVDG